MTTQINIMKEAWSRQTLLNATNAKLISLQLLEIAPQFHAAFKCETKEQSGKLFEMISNILIKLDKLDDLVPEEKKLLNIMLTTMLSLTITNWLQKIN
ncbi:MAG: hypothetical protein ABI723_08520 [Bacteroidia bacterium]